LHAAQPRIKRRRRREKGRRVAQLGGCGGDKAVRLAAQEALEEGVVVGVSCGKKEKMLAEGGER
jgi:hypothetical protein